MSESALCVTGVRKSFGSHIVLDGIDLRVDAGTIAAVLGPSGGGKTTLLRIIAGFEMLDAGSVTVGGGVVASRDRTVPPEQRRIGIVPQEGALFPHLDVAGNIAFGLARDTDRARRVAELLELVGLPGCERLRPAELSGGQQQRVALARSLAPSPRLVLLDEPFSSLDAALRAQVRDDVVDILRAAGTTAVLVTHDQQEALSVADTVAVLIDGVIAQCDDPVTLYEQPVDQRVATFVGDAVLLDGLGLGDQVDTPLGRLRCRPGTTQHGPVSVVVRPEHVRLTDVDGDGVRAVVSGRSFFGHDAFVRLDLATPSGPLRLTARVAAGSLPGWGAEVAVRVDGAVSVFPR